MAHAWNYVKVDGNWYLVDTTWGDTFTGGKDKFALLGAVPGSGHGRYPAPLP